LIYLVTRNLFAWARPSREDAAAKDIEILMLRHQLAVAQRTTPPRELQSELTRADRAWLALPAGLLSKDRLVHLRLIITPAKPTSRRTIRQPRWSQPNRVFVRHGLARRPGTKMPSRDHQGIGYASRASNANVASQCSPM
jgi:putative transposase